MTSLSICGTRNVRFAQLSLLEILKIHCETYKHQIHVTEHCALLEIQMTVCAIGLFPSIKGFSILQIQRNCVSTGLQCKCLKTILRKHTSLFLFIGDLELVHAFNTSLNWLRDAIIRYQIIEFLLQIRGQVGCTAIPWSPSYSTNPTVKQLTYSYFLSCARKAPSPGCSLQSPPMCLPRCNVQT